MKNLYLSVVLLPTKVVKKSLSIVGGVRRLSDGNRGNDDRLKHQSNYNIPKIKKTPGDDLSNFNLATHILRPWVEKQPNKTALWITDGKTTKKTSYLDIYTESRSLSSALTNGRFPTPKSCLVVIPKIKPWWIINLAGSWCEMAISPGAPMLSQKDLLFRIKSAKLEALFVDTSIMNKIDDETKHLKWRILVEETPEKELENLKDGWLSYHQLLAEGSQSEFVDRKYNGDSISQLFFTSGTTGYPKTVHHTQMAYGLGHIPTARDWLSLEVDDLIWNISDLGWAKAAFSTLYAPLISGCTMFIHQMPRFNPQEILRSLENEPITTLCLPPTALRALLQEDLGSFKPRSLKIVTSAGEPLNPEVLHMWHKFTGIHIREGYGQTEMTLMCAVVNGVKAKPGTMGKAIGDYDIKILDDNLNELGPNSVGQIGLSLKNGWPTGLFKGYRSQELNDKAFVSGYYLTGDRALIDDEGYIVYVGRSDDIIISAGYTIGPYEVESALIEHPAVVESGVVASPDYERGHVVKAFVVLNEEYKRNIKTSEQSDELIKELQDFVKNSVAPYKYPRQIEFVDSLPKTISGKIRRVELRQRHFKSSE